MIVPSKTVLYAGVALALSALVALGIGWGVSSYRGIIEDARQAAYAERDAHWRGEIEKHNAAIAKERADQALAAAAASATASASAAREAELLTELEKRNAALPGGDTCGLDRDRVRILDSPSRQD